MIKKLLGVVIYYKFDLAKLKESISTYIDALDELIIWQNSKISEIELFDVLGDLKGKIVILGNGENLFIAKALNCAFDYARANGYTHVLTMDQDSKFESLNVRKYREIIEHANNANAIFCPVIVSAKSLSLRKNSGGGY